MKVRLFVVKDFGRIGQIATERLRLSCKLRDAARGPFANWRAMASRQASAGYQLRFGQKTLRKGT